MGSSLIGKIYEGLHLLFIWIVWNAEAADKNARFWEKTKSVFGCYDIRVVKN